MGTGRADRECETPRPVLGQLAKAGHGARVLPRLQRAVGPADVIRSLGEKVRLNKALFAWVGFDSDEVTYQRNCRRAGKTRMGYWKLWNMALDGIFASSTKPLRVWTYVGSALAVASFLYAAWIFLRTLVFGVDVPGYASTLVLILMFGGVQLFAIGILGEYVGRILTEVRERPLYIVRSSHPAEATRAAGARPHGI